MHHDHFAQSLPKRNGLVGKIFSKKSVVLFSAFTLAVLFIYAAYNKLIIYNTFVSQLKSSPITKGFENILAWAVPGLELLIAALLIIPRTRLAGLWSGFFLMLAFTIYIYVLPHFFKHPGCSCGGIISSFGFKEHFYFNLAFTLLGGLGVSLHTPRKK